jgi:hypothetical protein
MSRRITGLTAMAVVAILGVGRSAVAEDPGCRRPSPDASSPGGTTRPPSQLKGEAL